VAYINTRLDHDADFFGLSTGWKDLDAQLGGLEAGNLTIVGARPSMGKTVFMLNVAEYVGIKLKKKVLILNFEMDELQLGRRQIASLARINQKVLKHPKEATQQDWAAVASAVNQIQGAENYIVINAHGKSGKQIAYMIKKVHKQLGGLDFLGVDYLSLVKVDDKNRNVGLGEVTKIIRNLSKRLGYHALVLSQLNRGLESRSDKRPVNADLRESGEIEQDADNIIMLYRDEMYDPDTMDKGVAEFIVRKCRDGELGTIRVAANLHHGRFDDLAPSHYQNDY
jgi:replicative DNA helicase